MINSFTTYHLQAVHGYSSSTTHFLCRSKRKQERKTCRKILYIRYAGNGHWLFVSHLTTFSLPENTCQLSMPGCFRDWSMCSSLFMQIYLYVFCPLYACTKQQQQSAHLPIVPSLSLCFFFLRNHTWNTTKIVLKTIYPLCISCLRE